jgi:hypothetical protein
MIEEKEKKRKKNQSGNTERRAEVLCSKVAQNW